MARERVDEQQALLKKDDDDDVKEAPGTTCYTNARYVLAFWSFFGFFNLYCLRFNMSVALVCMVNTTAEQEQLDRSQDCPRDTNTTTIQGEFEWKETTQGLILGAFFFGYMLTQIPGGWLAEKVGGKIMLGLSVLGASAASLLTPLAARAGLPYLILTRVLVGVCQGVAFPAMHAIWAVWAPVYERSKLVSTAFAGGNMGTVFALAISGVLCRHGFEGGWPSVFYFFGGLGCLWFVFWMVLIYDSPSTHPRISNSEKDYILSSIGRRERLATPWCDIVKSRALWGTTIGHFSSNWGFYTMLTCLPTYMKLILHFDIQQSGFLSGLPYLILWLTEVSSGVLADFLRKRRYLSTVATRKLMTTLGAVLPATFLVAAGSTGCDYQLAVALVTLGGGWGGFVVPGIFANHLDIAPRFAGTLMGITNTVATLSGIFGTLVVGILTDHQQTAEAWQTVFVVTAGIYVGGAALFILLGRGRNSPGPDPLPVLK